MVTPQFMYEMRRGCKRPRQRPHILRTPIYLWKVTDPRLLFPMASGNDDGSTAVVAAIDSIINETQTYLQYPCDHGDSPSAPSFNLNYRFNASLSVSLDTEWSLFPGLVLENVSIATGLQKQRDKPGTTLTSRF